MPQAARLTDRTEHGAPLGPGAGSPNVNIGGQKAWRALPAGATGAAVESAANAIKQFMASGSLTPAQAAVQLAQIQAGLSQAGANAASEGNPGAASAAASANSGLAATNATLTATWTTASAPPGAMPAATAAYTEAIKAALAVAAGAVFSAIAGAADMHNCPKPCPNPLHGPGVVTKGSKSVRINGLPAVRKGDKVIEACGGADPIAGGCGTVNIGDIGPLADLVAQAVDEAAAAPDEAAEAVVEARTESEPAPVSKADPAYIGPLKSKPTQPPAPSATQSGPQDWIGIVLRDFDGTPMPGQAFTLKLKNGTVLKGVTDARGYARFDGIPPGAGEATFDLIPDSERPNGKPGDQHDQPANADSAGGGSPARPSFDW
ncbi:MAG: PAAR domain-containing protein [Phycisphaerae bacterium]